MTKRLATMCLVTVLLVGISSPRLQAQKSDPSGMKGLDAVEVVVESISEGAKSLGLTKETIQTDVELKLRLAGLRAVTDEQSSTLPGAPFLYVNIHVLPGAGAASIDVDLCQNAMLLRNDQIAPAVKTWSEGSLLLSPTSQRIRDKLRDHVDKFLNDWLSVNPKK